jgi:hypothetical protein
MFCLLSIQLVLAHMQLVMSSVSHVQQEYKHEVQQHNSIFASGLNTSDIMSRQCKKLSGCKILSSTWQTWERVSRIKPEKIINYDKITAVKRSFLFLTGFFHPIGQIAPPPLFLPTHQLDSHPASPFTYMPTAQPSTPPLHAYAIHIFTYLFTLPPTYLLTYAMLTSTNENNANADIAFTWLALN